MCLCWHRRLFRGSTCTMYHVFLLQLHNIATDCTSPWTIIVVCHWRSSRWCTSAWWLSCVAAVVGRTWQVVNVNVVLTTPPPPLTTAREHYSSHRRCQILTYTFTYVSVFKPSWGQWHDVRFCPASWVLFRLVWLLCAGKCHCYCRRH